MHNCVYIFLRIGCELEVTAQTLAKILRSSHQARVVLLEGSLCSSSHSLWLRSFISRSHKDNR